MHVVIDLGEMHTYLACWERGKPLHDACIKLRLPGVTAFKPTAGRYSWERENLRDYFSYLYREYLLPSRIMIESASLAIPGIFDLKARRVLLDILEEIFGLYEASIIPHPIALIAGLQMHTHPLPLSGDVLLIEAQESSYNFAFISIIETIGITLEKQFSGAISELLAEAERTGYYSAAGWRLDHILLAGSHAQNSTMEAFFASLPPDLNVIHGHDLEFTAAEGLADSGNDKNSTPVGPFNIVYPYEFYLEKKNSPSLVRIPFDTTNLELNCGCQYRLINLNKISIYNLAADENRVHFRIYELITADESQVYETDMVPLPVLEIVIPQDDLPPYMELVLDMAAATIQLDLLSEAIDETAHIPVVFGMHLRTNQQKLYETIKKNKQNEGLVRDWNQYQLSPHDDDPSLSDQIDHTLFHLYGLLQLWHGK